jgi:hypothetical protein
MYLEHLRVSQGTQVRFRERMAILGNSLESYLVAGEQDQSQDVSAGSIKLDRN